MLRGGLPAGRQGDLLVRGGGGRFEGAQRGVQDRELKGRTFPFTAALRTLMVARDEERARLKQDGRIVPLVFHRDGEKIVSFHRAWRTACRKAGCTGRIPHDLRRTAVRTLVRAGVPETVAMKLTGHVTRSVFMRYDVTSDADLKVAVRLLDGTSLAEGRR